MYNNGSDVNFEPEWLLVVTWKDATPWYGRNNNDEVSACLTANQDVFLAIDSQKLLLGLCHRRLFFPPLCFDTDDKQVLLNHTN